LKTVEVIWNWLYEDPLESVFQYAVVDRIISDPIVCANLNEKEILFCGTERIDQIGEYRERAFFHHGPADDVVAHFPE
jgi:hypothetical protein